jgi:hypothetical protein
MVLHNTASTGQPMNGFPVNTTKITIYNNGNILGAHGVGGAGGTAGGQITSGTTLPAGMKGSNGIKGGTAIFSNINYDVPLKPNLAALTVINNGKILAGGGGGGGGAAMNFTPQSTGQQCRDVTTYSYSNGTCKRRCGAGGDCPECRCDSRCSSVGLNCQVGITCGYYWYSAVKWESTWWGGYPRLITATFRGVPCWQTCNVSKQRICTPVTVTGSWFRGNGTSGGIGFGSGGAIKPYPHTGSNWTFNGYPWFESIKNSNGLRKDSENYNGNLFAYDYIWSSGENAGQPAPFETEPRFLPANYPTGTAVDGYGSPGGPGSVFGVPYTDAEYLRGRGLAAYNLAGYTGSGGQSTGGASGLGGFAFEINNIESQFGLVTAGGSQLTVHSRFSSTGRRVLTESDGVLSWQPAPTLSLV